MISANDFNKMYQNLYVNSYDGTDVQLKGYNDVKVGDIIEGYDEVEIKRTL